MLTVCANCNEVFPEEQEKCPCCGMPAPEPSPELRAEEEKLLKERDEAFEKVGKATYRRCIIVLCCVVIFIVGLILTLKGSLVGVAMCLVALLSFVIVLTCIGDEERVREEYAQKLIALRAKYSYSPETYEQLINAYIKEEKMQKQATQVPNVPKVADETYAVKCPTCGSPNCERISATSKVVSAAAFGLYSNKRTKQFKCNNCEYEW